MSSQHLSGNTPTVTAGALAGHLLTMETDRRTARVAPAEQAEREAMALDRPDLQARARLVAADALARNGDLAAAAPILDQVNAWAIEHGDPYVLARSHFLLSILHTCIGDLAEARRHASLSVDHLPDDTPPRIRGAHLVVLAMSLDGVPGAEAARYHAEALDIAAAAGDHEVSRAVLNNMAYAAYQEGDTTAAVALVERLRGLVGRARIALRPADLDTVARVEMLRGGYAEAERILLPLVQDEPAEWNAESDMLPEILLTLAEAQRQLGAGDRAQVSLDRCRTLCAERGLVGVAVRARREQARLYAAAGRYREAYEEHCRYDSEAQELRADEREAQARLTQLVFESREGRRDTARFRDMALRDPLTGLYNRRFVDGQLPALVDRAAHDGHPLSVALVDVDFFKRINDTLSHEMGDRVLQKVAALLTEAIDEPATVARLGGEEFVLVIPGDDAGEALGRCERIRHTVHRYPWRALTGQLPVTVSIGVTTVTGAGTTPASLLSQADRNLYAAKRSGRNRVLGDPA
ncbi:diguanylate cyclase [Planosporangium sp. 12N6]|uniref:tetratricopeptide repeat-containing diguanylate cyclase n=1 Tax=Planosporangium spinosum TaxID=3402278 RepID=UPI003CF012CD